MLTPSIFIFLFLLSWFEVCIFKLINKWVGLSSVNWCFLDPQTQPKNWHWVDSHNFQDGPWLTFSMQWINGLRSSGLYMLATVVNPDPTLWSIKVAFVGARIYSHWSCSPFKSFNVTYVNDIYACVIYAIVKNVKHITIFIKIIISIKKWVYLIVFYLFGFFEFFYKLIQSTKN